MYALVALGYTMVYGIINLINFARSAERDDLRVSVADSVSGRLINRLNPKLCQARTNDDPARSIV